MSRFDYLGELVPFFRSSSGLLFATYLSFFFGALPTFGSTGRSGVLVNLIAMNFVAPLIANVAKLFSRMGMSDILASVYRSDAFAVPNIVFYRLR